MPGKEFFTTCEPLQNPDANTPCRTALEMTLPWPGFMPPMSAPVADTSDTPVWLRSKVLPWTTTLALVPVIANVTAGTVIDPDEIRRLLVEQVTGMVRWRESVHLMKDAGVDTLIELGAGKVLTGLTKRVDGDLTGISVGTPADIEEFAKKK